MSEKPRTTYRGDYRPPDYWIDRVDLHFDLEEERTQVRATLAVRRNEILEGDPPPFVLDGEDLTLLDCWLDGRKLAASEYVVDEEALTVARVPARFEFETLVEIDPRANTELSGLYCSGAMFCTQCEAMGFRRITYYLDRPDVMARFTTTLEADATRYPVLLSNGNRIEAEELPGGRRRVKWEDPFPKPSYLFALVAGDLRCVPGSFETRSGREVELEFWVEPQNVDRCDHALASLQNAMRWDEQVFGREYDLDIYMVVAVGDFNMGAMENKGLNIFNSKYVLARPETATDDDCAHIEGVIGHEYFHNWTGNRVTCRDWFQLTLKEGLTVFRDQLFSADMGSAAVQRIEDVKVLRSAQFAEDAGPMAHPIRPESYISMDNFYTATVYNKGAEVIRMLHTLLGEDGFRSGMDLYFERHDGEAVTCDDFVAALADANGWNPERFKRWYAQSGTPTVEAVGSWDASEGRYTLRLRQSNPVPAEAGASGEEREPLLIPVVVGLLGSDGRERPIRLVGEQAPKPNGGSRVLELCEREQDFIFEGLDARPVVSILRGFSAPVRLRMERGNEDLAFLMSHDTDSFNRWDAGQELATRLLLEQAERAVAGKALELDALFIEAFGRVLDDGSLDGAQKGLALALPSEKVLGQEQETIAVDALFEAREFAIRTLAAAHRERFMQTHQAMVEFTSQRGSSAGADGIMNREAMNCRALKNAALAYLAAIDEEQTRARVVEQFRSATNMTDSQASFSLLVDLGGELRDEAVETFYERWKDDPLVLDKWFSVQAFSKHPDTLERVLALAEHPDFNVKNPNRLRALVGSFCAGNQKYFHAANGAGYRFLTDVVLEVDALNPQMAARLVSQFNQWKRFDGARQGLMQSQLEIIAARPGISKDTFEIVTRALE